jgi:hypothetical protein
LLPEEGEGGGWSGYGRRWASAIDVLLDLLQNGRGEQVREGRPGEVKELEERGRAGAYWRRRIQPEILAGMRGSGEGFRRPCCGSSEETKGERERMPRAIYRHRRGIEMAGINRD